ncbi:male-specific histamine-binding salivary protein-like [Rhipicephalus sanguineus]|uniref:male-specific histamine-binding salivary protein-like n=1 Tax=Rhipicephalus sanguineus TaxID=34632 RepID=UPI00189585ED|nr:male-specific histamine-binding salivary protein-like [Rhipicephalus sanguineus]
MHYTVLVLLLHVAFGSEFRHEQCPLWANSEFLAKYQSAWKTLNQTNTTRYFLTRSTYNSNPVWGKNFRCVNVRSVNVYPNQTVESLFTFKNGSGDEIYNVTDVVGVTSTYGYPTDNAIKYTLPNGTTLNDSVIFTDGQTCDILSVPYENNGTGCELWVKQEHLSETPLCCDFIFDAFCGKAGNYTVYHKDNCSNVLNVKDTSSNPTVQAS